MLIQIADTDIFCPFDRSLIRCQFSGDDIHKRGLAFSVCTDQADMFAFEETKRNIVENRTVTKTMRQIFYI